MGYMVLMLSREKQQFISLFCFACLQSCCYIITRLISLIEYDGSLFQHIGPSNSPTHHTGSYLFQVQTLLHIVDLVGEDVSVTSEGSVPAEGDGGGCGRHSLQVGGGARDLHWKHQRIQGTLSMNPQIKRHRKAFPPQISIFVFFSYVSHII